VSINRNFFCLCQLFKEACSSRSEPEAQYSYLVRVINPEQRSKYITKIWHYVRQKFDSPDTLKYKLIESFEDKLPSFSDIEIGYIEKRSNAKRWIEDTEDLEAMYVCHR